MSEISYRREDVGDNTPLYDCPECGDQTVLPEELDHDGVVDLECPTCGSEGLAYVDDLCRVGRTLEPHEDACYNEWDKRWPPEESPNLQQGAWRLCEEHYDEFENPPLPENAIGRCESEDCTIAVWEEMEDGTLLCESCRNGSTGGDDGE